MTEDERFLARWSRRKRGSDPPRAKAPAATPEAPPPDRPPGEKPPDELPDIESLDKDSDYTAFLREGVPEALRRAALRKLWRSDPVLANLDGLNDYDEDFAGVFTEAVTKTVKTAYRVGKGWLEEKEAEPGPGAAESEAGESEAGEGEEPPPQG